MALEGRTASVAAELEGLEARREPARALLAARREAAAGANAERDRACATLASESGAHETAHREIEGLESDVEAARSEVFSALNSATALRHALEHAGAARERVAETLSKLDVETGDLRVESERAAADRAALDGRGARTAIEGPRTPGRRESGWPTRIEHEWRARSMLARTRAAGLARGLAVARRA